MMKRDSQSYIISKLPESSRIYKNMKYLVIPEENGLPEYTPEAYNYVNAFFRNECLNIYYFETLDSARKIIEHWRQDYNRKRPQRKFKGLTPVQYKNSILVRNTTT